MAETTHQGWQLFIIELPNGGTALGIGKNLESILQTLDIDGADARPVTQQDLDEFRRLGQLPNGIFIAFSDVAN